MLFCFDVHNQRLTKSLLADRNLYPKFASPWASSPCRPQDIGSSLWTCVVVSVLRTACMFTLTVTCSVVQSMLFLPPRLPRSLRIFNQHPYTGQGNRKLWQNAFISLSLVVFMDSSTKLILILITVPLPAVGNDQTGSIWRRPAVLPVLHEWRRSATTAGSSWAVSHLWFFFQWKLSLSFFSDFISLSNSQTFSLLLITYSSCVFSRCSFNRDWRYHKEERVWITRAPGMEPTLKTNTYERGTYYFFDCHNWRKVAKVRICLWCCIFRWYKRKTFFQDMAGAWRVTGEHDSVHLRNSDWVLM